MLREEADFVQENKKKSKCEYETFITPNDGVVNMASG